MVLLGTVKTDGSRTAVKTGQRSVVWSRIAELKHFFIVLRGKEASCTISEVADLEVAVQTDYSHRDEATTAEEKARPAIETTTFPAK